MAKHEYTPRQALDEILKRVGAKAPELAAEIEHNINLGQEVEGEPTPRQRSNEPDYERKVSFPLEEALQVALDTLRAHFIEQPLFMVSADQNFAKAAQGVPDVLIGFKRDTVETIVHGDEVLILTGIDESKTLAFEVQPETRLVGTGEEILFLEPITQEQIAERRKSLDALRDLTNFSD